MDDEEKVTDWSKLTVAVLKEELRNRGLSATGRKADLVKRLHEVEHESAEGIDNAENIETTESSENITSPENKDDVVQDITREGVGLESNNQLQDISSTSDDAPLVSVSPKREVGETVCQTEEDMLSSTEISPKDEDHQDIETNAGTSDDIVDISHKDEEIQDEETNVKKSSTVVITDDVAKAVCQPREDSPVITEIRHKEDHQDVETSAEKNDVVVITDDEAEPDNDSDSSDGFGDFEGFVVIDEAGSDEDDFFDKGKKVKEKGKRKDSLSEETKRKSIEITKTEDSDKISPTSDKAEHEVEAVEIEKDAESDLTDIPVPKTAAPTVPASIPVLRNLCQRLGLNTGAGENTASAEITSVASTLESTDSSAPTAEVPATGFLENTPVGNAELFPFAWSACQGMGSGGVGLPFQTGVPFPTADCGVCKIPGHHVMNCPRKHLFCIGCSKIGHTQPECPGTLYTGWCPRCNLFGHQPTECPKNFCQCTKCFQLGHTVDECRNAPAPPVMCPRCSLFGHLPPMCPRNYCKCPNCDQIGHTLEECQAPPKPPPDWCPRCNVVGHMPEKCPKNMCQCLKCGNLGHSKEECNEKPGICPRCNKQGHFMFECPRKEKYCFKCKEKGHHLPADCPKDPANMAKEETEGAIHSEVDKLAKEYYGGWTIFTTRQHLLSKETATNFFQKFDKILDLRMYDYADKIFIGFMSKAGAEKALRGLWNTRFDPKVAAVNKNFKTSDPPALTTEEFDILIERRKSLEASYQEKAKASEKKTTVEETAQSESKVEPEKEAEPKVPSTEDYITKELKRLQKDYFQMWNVCIDRYTIRNEEIANIVMKRFGHISEIRMYKKLVFVSFMYQSAAVNALRGLWGSNFKPTIPTVNTNYKTTVPKALTIEEIDLLLESSEQEPEKEAGKGTTEVAGSDDSSDEYSDSEDLIELRIVDELLKLKKDYYGAWNIYVKPNQLKTKDAAKLMFRTYGNISEVRVYEQANMMFIGFMTQDGAANAVRVLWQSKFEPKVARVNPNFKSTVPPALTMEELEILQQSLSQFKSSSTQESQVKSNEGQTATTKSDETTQQMEQECVSEQKATNDLVMDQSTAIDRKSELVETSLKSDDKVTVSRESTQSPVIKESSAKVQVTENPGEGRMKVKGDDEAEKLLKDFLKEIEETCPIIIDEKNEPVEETMESKSSEITDKEVLETPTDDGQPAVNAAASTSLLVQVSNECSDGKELNVTHMQSTALNESRDSENYIASENTKGDGTSEGNHQLDTTDTMSDISQDNTGPVTEEKSSEAAIGETAVKLLESFINESEEIDERLDQNVKVIETVVDNDKTREKLIRVQAEVVSKKDDSDENVPDNEDLLKLKDQIKALSVLSVHEPTDKNIMLTLNTNESSVEQDKEVTLPVCNVQETASSEPQVNTIDTTDETVTINSLNEEIPNVTTDNEASENKHVATEEQSMFEGLSDTESEQEINVAENVDSRDCRSDLFSQMEFEDVDTVGTFSSDVDFGQVINMNREKETVDGDDKNTQDQQKGDDGRKSLSIVADVVNEVSSKESEVQNLQKIDSEVTSLKCIPDSTEPNKELMKDVKIKPLSQEVNIDDLTAAIFQSSTLVTLPRTSSEPNMIVDSEKSSLEDPTELSKDKPDLVRPESSISDSGSNRTEKFIGDFLLESVFGSTKSKVVNADKSSESCSIETKGEANSEMKLSVSKSDSISSLTEIDSKKPITELVHSSVKVKDVRVLLTPLSPTQLAPFSDELKKYKDMKKFTKEVIPKNEDTKENSKGQDSKEKTDKEQVTLETSKNKDSILENMSDESKKKEVIVETKSAVNDEKEIKIQKANKETTEISNTTTEMNQKGVNDIEKITCDSAEDAMNDSHIIAEKEVTERMENCDRTEKVLSKESPDDAKPDITEPEKIVAQTDKHLASKQLVETVKNSDSSNKMEEHAKDIVKNKSSVPVVYVKAYSKTPPVKKDNVVRQADSTSTKIKNPIPAVQTKVPDISSRLESKPSSSKQHIDQKTSDTIPSSVHVIESVKKVKREKSTVDVKEVQNDAGQEGKKKDAIDEALPLYPYSLSDWLDKKISSSLLESRVYITEMKQKDLLCTLLMEWANKSSYFYINRGLNKKGAMALFQYNNEKGGEAMKALTEVFGKEVKIVHPKKSEFGKEIEANFSVSIEEYPSTACIIMVESVPENTTDEEILDVIPDSLVVCHPSVTSLEIKLPDKSTSADQKFVLPEICKGVSFVLSTSAASAQKFTQEKNELEFKGKKVKIQLLSEYKIEYKEQFWDMCMDKNKVTASCRCSPHLALSDHKRIKQCQELSDKCLDAKDELKKHGMKGLNKRTLEKIMTIKEEINIDANRRIKAGLKFPEDNRLMTKHTRRLKRLSELRQTDALTRIVGEMTSKVKQQSSLQNRKPSRDVEDRARDDKSRADKRSLSKERRTSQDRSVSSLGGRDRHTRKRSPEGSRERSVERKKVKKTESRNEDMYDSLSSVSSDNEMFEEGRESTFDLYVGGIPNNMKKYELIQELMKLFRPYNATKVQKIVQKWTMGVCFAFVSFPTVEDAKRAWQNLNQTRFFGGILKINTSNKNKESFMWEQSIKNDDDEKAERMEKALVKMLDRINGNEKHGWYTISITNRANTLKETDVDNMFSKYGEVADCVMSQKFIYVCFKNKPAAEAAVEDLYHTELNISAVDHFDHIEQCRKYCVNCGVTGHDYQTCRKTKGSPDGSAVKEVMVNAIPNKKGFWDVTVDLRQKHFRNTEEIKSFFESYGSVKNVSTDEKNYTVVSFVTKKPVGKVLLDMYKTSWDARLTHKRELERPVAKGDKKDDKSKSSDRRPESANKESGKSSKDKDDKPRSLDKIRSENAKKFKKSSAEDKPKEKKKDVDLFSTLEDDLFGNEEPIKSEKEYKGSSQSTKSHNKPPEPEFYSLERLASILDNLKQDPNGLVTVSIYNEGQLLDEKVIKQMFVKYGEVVFVKLENEKAYISFGSKAHAMKAIEELWGTKWNIDRATNSMWCKVCETTTHWTTSCSSGKEIPASKSLGKKKEKKEDNPDLRRSISNLKDYVDGFLIGIRQPKARPYTQFEVLATFKIYGSVKIPHDSATVMYLAFDRWQCAVKALRENYNSPVWDLFVPKSDPFCNSCRRSQKHRHLVEECLKKKGYCTMCKNFGHEMEKCSMFNRCVICSRQGCTEPLHMQIVKNMQQDAPTKTIFTDVKTKEKSPDVDRSGALGGLLSSYKSDLSDSDDIMDRSFSSSYESEVEDIVAGTDKTCEKELLKMNKDELGYWSIVVAPDSFYKIEKVDVLQKFLKYGKIKDVLTDSGTFTVKFKTASRARNAARDMWGTMWKVSIPYIKPAKTKSADKEKMKKSKWDQRNKVSPEKKKTSSRKYSEKSRKKRSVSSGSSSSDSSSSEDEKSTSRSRSRKSEAPWAKKDKGRSQKKRDPEKKIPKEIKKLKDSKRHRGRSPDSENSRSRSHSRSVQRSRSRSPEKRSERKHDQHSRHDKAGVSKSHKHQRSVSPERGQDKGRNDNEVLQEIDNLYEDYKGLWNISVLNNGDLSEMEVQDMFSQYGNVRSVQMTKKRIYIGYDTKRAAHIAVYSLWGTNWDGRVPRKETTSRDMTSQRSRREDTHRGESLDKDKRRSYDRGTGDDQWRHSREMDQFDGERRGPGDYPSERSLRRKRSNSPETCSPGEKRRKSNPETKSESSMVASVLQGLKDVLSSKVEELVKSDSGSRSSGANMVQGLLQSLDVMKEKASGSTTTTESPTGLTLPGLSLINTSSSTASMPSSTSITSQPPPQNYPSSSVANIGNILSQHHQSSYPGGGLPAMQQVSPSSAAVQTSMHSSYPQQPPYGGLGTQYYQYNHQGNQQQAVPVGYQQQPQHPSPVAYQQPPPQHQQQQQALPPGWQFYQQTISALQGARGAAPSSNPLPPGVSSYPGQQYRPPRPGFR